MVNADAGAPGPLDERDLDEALRDLAERRPLFHAEADLQHALVWEIARRRPTASVRLERPFRVASELLHLDAVVRDGGATTGLELKHWTRKLVTIHEDEEFALRDHAAYDVAAYDFWKDVTRLERLVAAGTLDRGFAVALTNVPRFWRQRSGMRPTIDEAFRLHDGRTVAGVLAWGAAAAPGSVAGREAPLVLAGAYRPQWRDYSRVAGHEFRYVIVRV